MDPESTAYATFDQRVGACAFDLGLFAPVALAAIAVENRLVSQPDYVLTRIALIVFTLGYWIGLPAWGNTPGRWLVGIQVVDGAGKRPSIRQLLERSVAPGALWAWLWLVVLLPETSLISRAPGRWPDALFSYLALCPFIWLATNRVELPAARRTSFDDRVSKTTVRQIDSRLWIFRWLAFVMRAASAALAEEARLGVDRARREISWFVEAVGPLGRDLQRCVAVIIDFAILATVFVFLKDTQGPFAATGSWYFVFLIVAAVILWLMPVYGTSPGKHIAGLRIVNMSGEPPGYHQALVRSMAPGVTWLTILLLAPHWSLYPGTQAVRDALVLFLACALVVPCIQFVAVLQNPDQRPLHDVFADTHVVVTRGDETSQSWRVFDGGSWHSIPRLAPNEQPTPEEAEMPPWLARRCIGLLLDIVLFALLREIVTGFLPGYDHMDARLLVQGALFVGYFVVLVAVGTTPGSWVAGVQIVSASDGKLPGIRRAAVRMALYLPLVLLPFFGTTWLAHSYEAAQFTMMLSDLLLIWLVCAVLLDLRLLLGSSEALHNRLAGTIIERSASGSRRAALGARIVYGWRWLKGDESEPHISTNLHGR